MKNILKIMANDFKHIITNVVAVVIVMGLSILPSLYAWFNINSNWDPYSEEATSNLKIAVYSNDEGILLKDVSLNIGDTVVEALHENNTIGWRFPKDEREAVNGVYSGEFYAALIIPKDFTESIASVMDGDISGGKITYYSNEKKNAIGTKITDKAKTAVQNQVNSQVFSTVTEVVVKLGDTLKNIEEEGSKDKEAVDALDMVVDELSNIINLLGTLESTSQSATATAKTLNDLVPKMIDDIEKDLTKLSAATTGMSGLEAANVRLNDYVELLEKGELNIAETKDLLKELQQSVKDIRNNVFVMGENEEFQKIISVLENEPEKIGEYFSSLVKLKTIRVYETKNYGSAMAPFYTVLAIWVGALILVAIIHVKVKPVTGIKDVRDYQEFFGRYALFFIIGQIQTLICVLGDICFLRIQCKHPFMFWLAAAMTSFVFTLFIYALTFAFGNVGEALAVIIMVIQVAGAGGTFPREVLPNVYQQIYNFLPFPYCMGSLRECVSGFYKNDYWIYIGKLAIFVVVSLIIGLLCKKPFSWLNEIIDKSKEKSDLMT